MKAVFRGPVQVALAATEASNLLRQIAVVSGRISLFIFNKTWPFASITAKHSVNILILATFNIGSQKAISLHSLLHLDI